MEEPLRLVRDQGPPLVAPVESFESFVDRTYERLFGALCLLTKDRPRTSPRRRSFGSSNDGNGSRRSMTRPGTSSAPR